MVRVKSELGDTLAKLQAIRDAIKGINDNTVRIKIKENFDKGRAAIAEADKEVKNIDRDTGRFRRTMSSLGGSFKGVFRDINQGVKDMHGGLLRNIGGGIEGLFRSMKRGLHDAWAGVKDLGRAAGDVGKVLLGTAEDGMTLGKALGNVGSAAAEVVGGLAEMGPAALVAAAGLAAILVPLGALVAGLLSAAGALTAGAIGIGALLAVGIPAVKNLMTGINALNQAQGNYAESSKNLNIALKTSKQDMAQYRTVIGDVNGGMKDAVKLLRDQNVRWSDLTAAQKRNVVALSENKQAVKDMSPAMKTALNALIAQKQAYDNLTPTQRKFASSLSGLSAEWHKLQTAAEPVLTTLLTDLTKIAQDALPLVLPLINATGNSIHKLLVRADNFVKSEQFKAWVKKVTNEIPGVISAIGNFISKLGNLFGRLTTTKSGVQDLKNTLNTLMTITNQTIRVINDLDNAFRVAKSSVHLLGASMTAFLGPIGLVVNAVQTLIGWLHTLSGTHVSWGGNVPNLPGLGGGGVGASGHRLAKGTPAAPPGWSWTGEEGPELTNFKGGEVVIPHGPSMAIARGFAGGAGFGGIDSRPIIVNIDGRQLFKIMKGRVYGYNVANNNRSAGGQVRGTLAPG